MHETLVSEAKQKGWRGTTAKLISADEVRRAYRNAARGRFDGEPPEEALRACVDVLVHENLLSATRTNDRENTPMPVAYRLTPVAAVTPRADTPMPIWHPKLHDLAKPWAQAHGVRRLRYEAVNRWLKSDPDPTPIPIRERSLEVFVLFGAPECHENAEKALDPPNTGALFGEEERLLDLLRTFRVPPPLLSETVQRVGDGGLEQVGSGDVLLVVENATTWWSIVNALPPAGEHRVGYVAWGLGASFVRSVHSIAERHHITEVRYFGDLDVSGVRIPFRAASAVQGGTLPPVAPAVHLYGALLATGRPTPARQKERLAPVPAERVVEWLDPAHRTPTMPLLIEGRRLAQEWVNLRYLTTTTDWHKDLR